MNAYRAYDAIEERKWAEQSLTEEKQKWIDDRAQEIIDALPKEPSGLFRFSVPMDKSPYEGLRSDAAGEAYNNLISAVAYAWASSPPRKSITSFRSRDQAPSGLT